MAAKSGNDKVIFRRVNGRIVPIRIKSDEPKYLSAGAFKSAATGAVVGGGSTYATASRYQNKFRLQSTRMRKIATRYRTRPKPQMEADVVLAGKKRKYMKRLEPNIFQQTEYRRKMMQWQKGRAKADRWLNRAKTARQVSRQIGKMKGRAALAFGAIGALGSYISSVAIDGVSN